MLSWLHNNSQLFHNHHPLPPFSSLPVITLRVQYGLQIECNSPPFSRCQSDTGHFDPSGGQLLPSPTLPQSSPTTHSSLPSLVVSLTQVTFIHLGAVHSNWRRPTLTILRDHILPSLGQANTDPLQPRRPKVAIDSPQGMASFIIPGYTPEIFSPRNYAFLLRNGHSRAQTQTQSRVLLGSYISQGIPHQYFPLTAML